MSYEFRIFVIKAIDDGKVGRTKKEFEKRRSLS